MTVSNFLMFNVYVFILSDSDSTLILIFDPFYFCCSLFFKGHMILYDTIRYDVFTCAQKLTRPLYGQHSLV